MLLDIRKFLSWTLTLFENRKLGIMIGQMESKLGSLNWDCMACMIDFIICIQVNRDINCLLELEKVDILCTLWRLYRTLHIKGHIYHRLVHIHNILQDNLSSNGCQLNAGDMLTGTINILQILSNMRRNSCCMGRNFINYL